MKLLIYSDVHGNLPAFEKMLEMEPDCEMHICLGDLVNYGPWSDECIDLASSLRNPVLIMGNHEEAFIDGFYPGSNPLVQTFFQQNISGFHRREQIKTFVSAYQLDKFLCTHTIMDKYIYPDTDVVLDNNYIIGHSHHQFKYINSDFELYNAGSVGQNRKYINVINYLTYDTETNDLKMKRQLYNVALLINEMKAKKFPEICLDYYLQKERL
ncbi:metallophosphoesterase [Pedobacter sp. MC2016-14]|uniref:metallophosphoesterase family protein n=1 Tax=Pedobacter sp. MC2016-14 TaxID=2897327 RepID=UPI001E5436EC|nr:metallophosphoesterase [Pedobacter sp. MC2016-14]MCD0486901.1 metallophosphoesterase [Pedobacter sp. MC2016-14]